MAVENLYFDGISWCDAVGVFTDKELTLYYAPSGNPQIVEIVFSGYKRSWDKVNKILGPCDPC